MKHLDIKIFGKVQGVFFRASARDKAEKLEINGFAENLPDGSVHIEAEGKVTSLEEFLEWCKSGSQTAQVEDIKHTFSDKLENFESFTIR